jgi:hypothetical protein
MQNPRQVYPQGRVTVMLTAAQYIAIATLDKAQLYQSVTTVNQPAAPSLLGTVQNGETVFGPYASGGTFDIVAGAAPVSYEIGVASPRNLSEMQAQLQGAPGVLNATGTLTAAMILAGIVTSTTAAAVVATLDTGAVMDTVMAGMRIGDSFDWAAINTGGANAFTVTASAGHTIVGSGVVALGSAATFRTRRTAAQTWITYRLSGL